MSNREAVPKLIEEPGWRVIEPLTSVGTTRSFVSGDPQGDRLRVRYFWRDFDNALVGKAWFGPGAEGPPGHAHGGSIAALLDEAMGCRAWWGGHKAVAVRLITDFRQLLPLGTMAILEAWLAQVDGRKVLTRSRLIDAYGNCFAEAEGIFIKLADERFAEMANRTYAPIGSEITMATNNE